MEVTGSERARYTELVLGKVGFLELFDAMKSPDTTLYNIHVTHTALPALRPNVGAQPIGRTVVFDIDTKTLWTPEEQVEEFRIVFGLDLTGTLTVRTPSGGLHIYVTWPDEVPLPGNWRLSTFNHESKTHFMGDLRAAGTNGHAVIPESIFEGKIYRLAVDAPIKSLSLEEVEVFFTLYTLLKHKEQKAGIKGEKENLASSGTANTRILEKTFSRPLQETLERLKIGLSKRDFDTWHERRAFVFNGVQCCQSNGTIVEYWQALDLGWDTSRQARVTVSTMYQECARLDRYPRLKHDFYCPHHHTVKPMGGTLNEEEIASRALAKLKVKSRFKTPRVIDFPQVIFKLNDGRQKPGTAYPLAVAIVEDFVQPWCNFGVQGFLLGDVFLSNFYNATPAEIKKAKRMLLEKGILKISVRPSASGRTTVFKVESGLVQEGLSKLLRALRYSTGQEVNLDARSGVFFDAVGKSVVAEAPPVRLAMEKVSALLPARQSAGTVVDYLLKQP
jgi:hypothetical protein